MWAAAKEALWQQCLQQLGESSAGSSAARGAALAALVRYQALYPRSAAISTALLQVLPSCLVGRRASVHHQCTTRSAPHAHHGPLMGRSCW